MQALATKCLRIVAPHWNNDTPLGVKKVMLTALEIIAFSGMMWGMSYLPCSTWYGLTVSYMTTTTLFDAFSRDGVRALDGGSKNISLLDNVWLVFLLYTRFNAGPLLSTDSLSLASNVFILLSSYGVYEQFT